MELCPSTPYQLVSKSSGNHVFLLKVTDNFLEKIEKIIENGFVDKLSLTFSSDSVSAGVIQAGSDQFEISHNFLPASQGSLEYFKQTKDKDVLHMYECIRDKFTIKNSYNEAVAAKTKARTLEAEADRKSAVTKLIDSKSLDVKNSKRKNPSKTLHRSKNISALSSSSSFHEKGKSEKPSLFKPSIKNDQLSSGKISPLLSTHPIPLRTRILYLLALHPLNRSDIISRLKLNDEKEKQLLEHTLSALAKLKETKFYLMPACFQEIDFSKWSYSDVEKQIVRKRALEAFDELNLPPDAPERANFLEKNSLSEMSSSKKRALSADDAIISTPISSNSLAPSASSSSKRPKANSINIIGSSSNSASRSEIFPSRKVLPTLNDPQTSSHPPKPPQEILDLNSESFKIGPIKSRKDYELYHKRFNELYYTYRKLADKLFKNQEEFKALGMELKLCPKGGDKYYAVQAKIVALYNARRQEIVNTENEYNKLHQDLKLIKKYVKEYESLLENKT